MKITVFTPTYNRKYIINDLYQSLLRQTYTDFEWLVIDDGSTDGSAGYFDQIVNKNEKFPVRYYWSENRGKQKQINRALDLAEGDLFITVDSDDKLTPNALFLINKWGEEVENLPNFCGFSGSCGNMRGVPTNPVFSTDYIDATFYDREPSSNNFIGYDRAWVFFTKIHRRYKYPEFDGEKFITEAVVWNRMAHDGYKIRCFNDVIYLWEHQNDGYTSHIERILKENPAGYGLWLQERISYFSMSTIESIKIYYSFYSTMSDLYNLSEIARFVGIKKWKLAVLAGIRTLRRSLSV